MRTRGLSRHIPCGLVLNGGTAVAPLSATFPSCRWIHSGGLPALGSLRCLCCRYPSRHTATALRAVLVVSRRTCARGPTKGECGDLAELDDLEAYEQLLLSDTPDTEPTQGTPFTVASSFSSPPLDYSDDNGCNDALSEVLALLPRDGAAVRLTELTPSLDVEAICETHGSVLRLLQQHPHVVACKQDHSDGTGRWYVRRLRGIRGAVSSPSHGSAAMGRQGAEGIGSTTPVTDSQRPLLASTMTDLALEETLRAEGLSSSSLSSTSLSAYTSTPAVSCRRRKQSRRQELVLATAMRTEAEGVHPARVPSDAPAAVIREADWAALASALPPSPGTTTIATVRREGLLPPAILDAMSVRGCGLLRLLHEHHEEASVYVSVALDGVIIGRAGATTGPVWTPQAAAALAAASLPSHSGGSKDLDGDWVVDLGLGEQDDDNVLAESVPLQTDPAEEHLGGEDDCGPPELALDVDAPEVFYGGPSLSTPRLVRPPSISEWQHGRKRRGRRAAGAAAVVAPRKASASTATAVKATIAGAGTERQPTPPPLPGFTAKKPNPSSSASVHATTAMRPPPASSAELLATHTQLALERGWRTPAQMLDLIVECVPAFPVPVDALVMSDALARVLGAGKTMRQVVRVYAYYCEWDRGADTAQLRPEVSHPLKGKANVHYRHYDPLIAAGDLGKPKDTTGEVVDAIANAGRVPAAHTLRPTATTRAFPVLRPVIKSNVNVSAGSGAGWSGGRASLMVNAATGTAADAPLPLGSPLWPLNHTASDAVTPQSPASLLTASRWMWGLLATLDHATPTPIEAAVAAAVPSINERESVSRVLHCLARRGTHCGDLATDDDGSAYTSDNNTDRREFLTLMERHAVLLVESDPGNAASATVRLRPINLAPGCRGCMAQTALPAEVERQLRPLWRPIRSFTSAAADGKLTSAARADLLEKAGVRVTNSNAMSESQLVAAVATYLRAFGQCAWVDDTGSRVRRFTCTADLDDLTHVAVPAVAHFASAVEWQPVETVLQRMQTQLRAGAGLLIDNPAAGGDMDSGQNPCSGLAAMLRAMPPATVHTFLESHPKEVETQVRGSAVCVRRVTRFGSFGSSK